MITVVEENLLVVNREIEENLSKIRKHSKDRSDVELSLGCEEENLNFTLVKCEEDKEDKSVLVDNNNKEEEIDVDLDESKEETGGSCSIKNEEIISISSIEGEENLNFTLIKCEEDNSKLASSKSEQDNLIVESNEIETEDKSKNDKQDEEAKGVEGGGGDGNEEDNEESDSTSTTISIKTIDDIKTCKLTLDNIVMGPPTVCLYQAPGYIERTIADGPDDEGDDSVFENSITTEPGGYENERDEHLEQLVTRLENVTKRLESVPSKFFTETQEVAIQTYFSLPKQVESVDVSTGHEFEEEDQEFPDPPDFGEVEVEVDQNSEVDYTVSMSVGGYEDLVAGPFAEYLALSQKIGGDVAAHSKLVSEAFRIQKEFIKTAASRPAPSNQSEQVSLLGPTSSQIQLIQQFRENNRGSQYFNHLSAISESIPALGWVAVTPTPAPYVKEMNDAGQFYTNRVLKDWKEKDKNHVEWCKAWVQTLSELQKYIRQHHTTGLVWSKAGSVSSSASAAAAAAPPPPPPGGMPPPPPCMPVGDISASAGGDDRSALFAQINQGEDITKSLKKVTSDMQTHKNSSLRTGPAPFKAPVYNNSSSPMKSVPPANAPIDKPSVFSRDGKKWLVEYHKGNKDLVIENPEMNNVVYMYRCQDSTLIIKGKLNSIVMDSCRKSSIVFDSLVSSIEFVNCQSVQMQLKLLKNTNENDLENPVNN
ncbi:Similar to CAP1: Adenylyl cyclase-associated protein 1 (Homo sapiens) [Cotesia congregata]|uniref:Similar to CAP1: Adenylyl cyclase-associated protein 1 (Homo sapiens) n=1 Tax=Cotesia congregata TaxID=51543 RepID=A0A8J2MWH2_COTCN|nr:Similar to CAP1: Adenylyl cyclase-associated protein 1 (Homo sapiens) [Cotesia congregata]